MIKGRSLRRDIFLINSVVVVIILIMQFFYFAYISGLMTAQKKTQVDGLLVQINNKIEACISVSKTMQELIINNSVVRDFLLSDDKRERGELGSQLIKMVEGSGIDTNSMNIILEDMSSEYHYILHEPSSGEKKEILKTVPDINESFFDDDTHFFVVSANPYKYIYICTYAPINIYNTKTVGMRSIGRAIIINRFNVIQLLLENGFFNGIQLYLISPEESNTINMDIDFSESSNYLFSEERIRGTTWKITAKVDAATIKEEAELRRQRTIIITEIIIIAVLMCAMVIFLNRSIAKPAEYILGFLERYRLNGKGQRLKRLKAAEFDSISQNINNMLDNMEQMTRDIVNNQQKLYEKELTKNEAMLYALQSQVNPHFLYNTLDCMAGIALSCDREDIYNIAMGISDIMRYSLVDDIDVCVEEEIAIAEKYLTIQLIRFNGDIDIDIDIEDDVWNVGIIRMCIQPILENIFKYGMSSGNERCRIEIKGCKEGSNVKLSIKDNGNGMETDEYESLCIRLANETEMYSKEGKNGLVNINRRLKFKYGNDYGITINQNKDEFMEVIVTIPFNEIERYGTTGDDVK